MKPEKASLTLAVISTVILLPSCRTSRSPSISCENTTVPKDGKYHVDPSNPMNRVRYLEAWYPPGVSEKDTLWAGNTAQLALLADGTVLKYAWDMDDRRAKNGFDIKHFILSTLGDHERIVEYVGKHEHGLRFGSAAKSDVCRYLSSHDPGESPERLRRE
jgi:hypothetical protein